MKPTMFAEYLELYQRWSTTLAHVAWVPWRLLVSQCQAGVGAVDALLTGFGGKGKAPDDVSRGAEAALPEAPRSAEGLEQVALDRVGQGLPPPREVYEVRNRDRIDWARFPAWARPSDPELFEGCAHEG
jgi:hypothetical protein